MFKITLRTARELSGYTKEEVASHCGVLVDTLDGFEKDSSLITVAIIRKIIKLYKVPLRLIFIGMESDFAKLNRAKKYALKKK